MTHWYFHLKRYTNNSAERQGTISWDKRIRAQWPVTGRVLEQSDARRLLAFRKFNCTTSHFKSRPYKSDHSLLEMCWEIKFSLPITILFFFLTSQYFYSFNYQIFIFKQRSASLQMSALATEIHTQKLMGQLLFLILCYKNQRRVSIDYWSISRGDKLFL